MKINKGTITNFNKKLLMGVFAITLSTTTLTGCKAYGFSYEKNSEGIRYATGSVDNKYINNCYVIEIYNDSFDGYDYYMTIKQDEYDQIKYLDVFTLETLYIENDEKYKNTNVTDVISVDEYLEQKNIEKTEYSVEFVEELLEKISEEKYLQQNNKQLMKEK